MKNAPVLAGAFYRIKSLLFHFVGFDKGVAERE